MKRIAVIGLGIMGHGIADNFLKNGYQVSVWNRSSNKADDLVEKGAHHAQSVKEAVTNADIVFEVTANDESSQQVWQGDEGIIKNAHSGQYLITCATISIEWTQQLADACSRAGLTFLDMPMTGGRFGAENGQLILLAGGDKNKLAEISNDLHAIAKDVKYFGKAGSGMRYKLILNTLQAIHMAGLGEALRMADAAGLDKERVGDALTEIPGGIVTTAAWRAYQEDPNPITFSVEWINKDLDYAAKMADSISHPLLDDVHALYEQAIEKGYAQADWTKINKL